MFNLMQCVNNSLKNSTDIIFVIFLNMFKYITVFSYLVAWIYKILTPEFCFCE